jgi:2-polyprenyl-3-methyl-5-hydroxy-6-metoxy-1,4-benzoquinol methylase
MESEKAQNRFDAAAETWDDNPGRQALARSLFSALARVVPLDADWTALDYGAGTGLVTLPVAVQVKSVMAADMSGQMLAQLADKAGRLQLNVTTQQLDATGALTLEAPVDLMVSTMVLHHVPAIESLLKQCVVWLKPGGYLALADLEPEDGTFHSDPESVYHHGIDPAALSEQLTGLGFSICHVERAHIMERAQEDGTVRMYPVFLLVAKLTA